MGRRLCYPESESLIQSQLEAVSKQNEGAEKLIKIEQMKIVHAQSKIAKVRDGYEAGLYGIEEAKTKIKSYQEAISRAEQELTALTKSMSNEAVSFNLEELERVEAAS